MLIFRKSFPYAWVVSLSVVVLLTTGVYWFVASRSLERPRGGSLIGLIYGVIAALIIVYELLIWLRKKVRATRYLFSAKQWLRGHIWWGLACVPFAFWHTGFHFGGQLTIGLMTLFVIVILSGVYGLILQHKIPKLLLDEVPSETIHAQIEQVSLRLGYDAEDMVLAICGPDPPDMPDRSERHFGKRNREEGGVVTRTRRVGGLRGVAVEARRITGQLDDGRTLRDAFYEIIVDYLLKGKQSDSKLVDATYSSRYFADLKASVDSAATDTIESLEDMCRQRREFDKQKRWFFLLHSWLWLHFPFSVALFVALVAHVVVALKYL